MATSIEERVVQMRFDNKQFEAGAAESMSTLEKLKAKLDFKGAAKGLDELGVAAEKVSLDSLGSGVDKVSVKFDALAVVAITALNRITNAAIDTGTNLIKSMSVDQVTTGFNKYEQKVQSVQTIMNATGKSIEEVEYELSKLIWFTDETSYSFSDMVNNVGKFTSNQIDLSVAVRAMMGIADAAGLAGVSVNNASHAMDGFSKAIAQGYMTRQNWQWIQTAHMDTAEFKQQLIEAAVNAGTLVRVGENAYQTLAGTNVSVANFEEGMKDAWISTDVMIKTLDRFGGAAEDLFNYVEENGGLASDAIAAIGDSLDEVGIKGFIASQEAKTFTDAINATKDAVSTGWMETFDIIFGNYKEAAELWTGLTEELYEIFASGAEGRNDILREWKEGGGRDLAIESIAKAWANVKEIIDAVKKAVRDVFPIDWLQVLNNATQGIANFAKNLKLSEESLNTISEVIKILLIPLNLLFQTVRVGWAVFTNVIKILWRLVDVLLALPTKIGGVKGALEKLFGEERYARLAEALQTIVMRLAEGFSILVSHVHNVIEGFKNLGNTKLGAVFMKLGDILSPIAEWILDRIVDGIEAIANADYSKITDWAVNGLSFVVDRLWDIKEVAGNAITAVVGFFKQLDTTSPSAFFNGIADSVKTMKTTIDNFIKNLGFAQVMSAIKSEVSGITEVISKLAGAFSELIARLTPAKILVYGFGITLVQMMNNISKAFAAFEGIGKSVSGMFGSVSGVFKAIQDRIKPNKVNQISWALLLLAAALVAMSLVNSERLAAATKAMVTLMGGLVVMTGAFAAIQKFLLKGDSLTAVLKDMSALMIGFAGSIAILAAAMLMLQKVNVADVWQPLAVAMAAMLSLALSMALLAKLSGGELPKNALTLVAFAVAIKMVLSSLQTLVGFDMGSIILSLGAMVAIVTIMGALSLMTQKMTFKAGAGMTLMILDLLLLAVVLKQLGKTDPETLIKGLMGYVGLFGVLISLAVVSRVAGNSCLKMGASLGAIAASMLLLGVAVKQIGALSLGEVAKGTAAIVAILAMFSVITKASFLIGKESGSMGKSFIAMAAAILILGVAIDYMGNLKLEAVVQGTLVIVALLGMFAVVTKAATGLQKATGTIAAIVTAIGVLTAAIMLLTLVDAGEALSAAVVLGTAMLALGATMRLIQGIDAKSGLAAVLYMGSVLAAFAVVFLLMKDVPADEMLVKSAALVSVMAGLGLVMKAIDGLKGGSKPSVGTLLGAVAVLAAAGVIVGVLSQISLGEGILEKAASLSLVMLALAGVMAVIDHTSSNAKNTLANAGVFAVVAAVVAGVVVAIGALASKFDAEGAFADNGVAMLGKLTTLIPIIAAVAALTWALSKVGSGAAAALQGAVGFAGVFAIVIGVIVAIGAITQALEDIGWDSAGAMESAKVILYGVADILGGFVGRLISAFGVGVMSGVAQMGIYLSEFAENIKPFLEAMKTIDQPVLDGVTKLAEMMILLTGSDLISSILMFGNNNPLENFGKQLVAFAPYFVEFADKIKNIPVDQCNAAGACLVGLAELISAIPYEGGFMQQLMGGQDFEKFGKGLKDFAEGFKNYCDVISTTTIDESMVEATKCVTDALIDMAEKVPASGGALQSFFGANDIGVFGTQLKTFATGLVDFFATIRDGEIDYDVVKSVADVGTALAKFAEKVPEAGGTLQGFFGAKDIGVFGTQLVAFGRSLVKFFALFSGDNGVNIDQTLVDACVTAGEAFAQFSEKVPRMGGALEWFTGSQDMGLFGEQIKGFGSGLASFFTAFKGAEITEADVTLANTAMDGFAKLSNSIGQTGGLSNAWSSSSLGEYGDQIKKLGEHLQSYYEKIKDVNFDQVNASTIAVSGILALQSGLSDNGQELSNTVKQWLKDMLASVDEVLDNKNQYSGEFYTTGTYIVAGVDKGISDNTDGMNSKMADFGNGLIDAFAESVGVQSPSVRMEEIGMYMIAGLQNGIEKNLELAKNAIVKMGENLLLSIQKFFGINSPSTVMRDEVGRYLIQGIAEGITEDMSAEDAAAQKAQNIINAFKDEFDKFSLDINTADLEFQLWSNLHPNASDEELKAKNIELLTRKLESQAERVNLANAQYQATLKQVGANARETQEAYNTYLQEQITMSELASELSELRGSTVTDVQAAFREYANFINENYDSLKEQGLDDEAIKQQGYDYSGWRPELRDNSAGLPTDVQGIFDEFMSASSNSFYAQTGSTEVVFQNAVVSAVDSATAAGVGSAGSGGASIADSLSTSFNEQLGLNTPEMAESVEGALDKVREVLGISGGEAGEEYAGNAINRFGWWLGDKGVEAANWWGDTVGSLFGTSVDESTATALEANSGPVKLEARNVAVAGAIEMAATGSNYENAGTQNVGLYADGVIRGGDVAKAALVSVSSDAANAAAANTTESENAGVAQSAYMGVGIMSNSKAVSSAATAVVEEAAASAKAERSSFETIGRYLAEGLANGMKLGVAQIKTASILMAKTAEGGTSSALEIRSPSRVFFRIGKYIDQGLANGVIDNLSIVAGSIKKLGNTATSGDPVTIRPVVDYDNAKDEMSKYRNFWQELWGQGLGVVQFDAAGNKVPGDVNFSGTSGGKWLVTTLENIQAVFSSTGEILDNILATQMYQDAQDFTAKGAEWYDQILDAPVYNFNQTIYSPKAVNSAEIYRQTNNQFSSFKTAVSSTMGAGGAANLNKFKTVSK